MVILQLSTEELSGIIRDIFRQEVTALQCTNPETDPERWFNLTELCNYLPDKPKKQTVYRWVCKSVIPYHKRSKKLFFLKSEIDYWLREGRKKTASEIEANAEEFLKNRTDKKSK